MVTITVIEAGNQSPVLATIGAQSVVEGINLAFAISASDADSTIPALSTSALPAGATFVDNGNGTASFDWTPDFTQGGSYSVTFYATDGLATDSEVVTITVTEAGNQTPVLAAIGAKSTSENVLLAFAVSATDADGTFPVLTTTALPTGAVFTDNADGSGSFDWTPTFTQAGVYNITFYAADGLATDSEAITITVGEAGNQSPILSSIGSQSSNENVNLTFAVSASDPDGTTPVLTAVNLPSGAVFTDNGNGSGSFDWTPDFTQAGTYLITFRASDGVLTDSEVVAVTIFETGNQSPVLSAIGAQGVTEGNNLNFVTTATDPDGTTPSFSSTTLPTGASYSDNGDGSATFDWTPLFTQSGIYNITFYATDGSLTDSEVVTITVTEAGNQPPTLAAIGPKGTTEGVNLNFSVAASDPDSTIPVLTTSTLPSGATFVDNANGSGTFDWTPDFTQSGTYNVTFYATDGIATDSEIVSITVNEVGNQAPVLATIGAQTTTENINLSFAVSAVDPDATTPVLTTSTLPSGAVFVDSGNGSGSFNWTPTFIQSGSYFVIFYASDGVASDSEVVSITVNEAGNQPPVLSTIGAKSTTEGNNLNFSITASDADGTNATLSTSTLPSGVTFIDNADGSASFDWTPNFIQSGSYNITFYASDGLATDSEVVTITVTEAGNQSPVLTAIGAKATTEGINLNFVVAATDADSTIPVLSTSSLPTGAVFTDNGNGSGTFDWTPIFTQAGTYNVTFYASDGLLTDSEVVNITVNEAGNQTPVLATIGARTTTEGVSLNFTISATDADSLIPALTTSSLPAGASFTDNGDGSGTFDWTPTFTQANSYFVIFIASDGVAADSEIVSITVNEAGNQAPTLAAIGAKSVSEGNSLNFDIAASDPDGTTPTLSALTLPSGATFTDNTNGTGTFDWTPSFTQAGIYSVTFIASDGSLADSEVVTITVAEAGNQSPVLSFIGAKGITEGLNLNFSISATDADATIPTLSTSALPSGATFTDNTNGTGTFDWTPSFTQSGTYNVTFYAFDGIATDSEVVTITVNDAGNQRPLLSAIGAQSSTEGLLLTFAAAASDPDGTTPSINTGTLPSGASFVDNGDGSGSFSWTTTFTQAGIYNILFIAADGVLSDSETVQITILEAGNQTPQLAAIGAKFVNEGANLNFSISASDPDGTTPSFSNSVLPTGATFVDNGNGSATFDWTPDFTQGGSFNITFRASDGALTDSEVVTITVTESGNQAPLLTAIGAQSVTEGVNLNFGISASDPDATIPALSTANLPTGASFVDNGDGSGTFDWTPDFTQSGTYNVTFIASDGLLADSEVVTISVSETGNQIPQLSAIGPKSTTEDVNLSFSVTASDPDGTIPALLISTLPSGATFTDNADGSGNFSWTPDFTQSGTYNVTFYASDGVLSDSEVVSITVNEVGNQAPVMTLIGAKSVSEGANLNFSITAADADGTTPTFSTSALPSGVTFTDNLNGSADFDWIPNFIQSGTYNITFIASDGLLSDSEVVTITVTEAGNQTPVLSSIGARSTTENVNLNFVVTASDADSTVPVLSTSALPSGATFVDNADGTADFDWTPTFIQAGIYNITFYATDGTATDSEVVTITVIEAGNQSPVLAAIGAQSVTEGQLLLIIATATDVDGPNPTMTTSALPSGATFTDNGNGTADFNWTPTFTQNGSYFVIFYATDGTASDSEIVAITVNEAGNQPPVLAVIGAQTTTEGTNLNFAVTATDADATIPTLSASTLPSGATFTDNANGSGVFDWTPNFTQSGIYSVTFYTTDGALTDSEVVTITVTESGNQTPVLSAIGTQSITEGTTLNFSLSATDADSTIPALATSALPSGATFVDNGDGSASFDWTPNFIQSGTYNVTFYASDGIATDSEAVTITVSEAGNQTPTLEPIGSQVTTEGIQLIINIAAADPDSIIPSLSSSSLPAGAIFTDNGNGSGSLDWTPTFTQAGIYSITFFASDGAAKDSEIVSITVIEAGNQTPLLTAIGAQATSEGVSLSFDAAATDADGTTPALTASPLPAGAIFTDNADGSGTFGWTPDFTQSGIYNVTFKATDGVATDSEVVTITVTESGNQAPLLSAIGAQSVTEGLNLNFSITAADPDSTIPVLTTSSLPTGATFIDNGDGSGTFDWSPDFTQSAVYGLTFYASDGLLIDSEVVTITVNEAGNQDPVLATIGQKFVLEGANLNFTISATDADATIPSLIATDLPIGASFVDNGDGSGTFDWTPAFIQSGTYFVFFYASDGLISDSEIVRITVNEAGNQLPVLSTIGSQSTTEGINLNFALAAVDPDSTIPTLSISSLPSGAIFTDNGNGTASFDWTPDFNQSGSYNVTFFASDGASKDSEVVTITVNEGGNQTPVLASIGNKTVLEGVNLNFAISATDVDATIPILTTSSLPSGAIFTDNGDGTADFDWTPNFIQSGTYNVIFYASDGSLIDSEVVNITVNEAGNQTPVLAAIGPKSTTEGATLNFAVTATDADSTIPALFALSLPSGASFTDNGDGSGSFNWSPDFTQSGTYNVTFYASDGSAADTEIVSISVSEAGNQTPILTAIGAQSTSEGVSLNFSLSATDADSTIPVLSALSLPSGAIFTDNGDGSATFDWTPDFTQAAVYNVTFIASDGVAADSEIVTITVGESGNQAPILTAIGSKTVTEGINLNFTVAASDPDSTIPTLSTSSLPSGAVFTDNGDGSASFDWTPNFIQSGTYNVIFYANDGFLSDSEIVTITVTEAGNQNPILATIGPKGTTEGINLNFSVSATDVDGAAPLLSTSSLPTGAVFIDNGDGSGTFDWTPDFIQSGSYNITFYATDDSTAVDSEVVTITVGEAGNQSPVLSAIGSQSVTEGSSLSFAVLAVDPDSTIPVLSTSTLPSGATFIDNGDGSGSFSWTPGFDQSGIYNLTFFASDGAAKDSEIVTITIGDGGNQSPILAAIGAQAVTEGNNLNFAVSATDIDATIPVLTTSTLPAGASFTDNTNGNGTFDWTPAFIQSGSYNITFYASDGSLIDSEVVTITVGEAGNQTPILTAIGAQTINEGDSLTISISAVDPDSTTPVLTTSTLPSGASFTDNGNGTGSFNWVPNFIQSGIYNIKLFARDASNAVDSEVVTITVGESGNQPPVLDSIGAQTTTENVLLSFALTATDPEGITPTMTSSSLPAGAAFVDNGNGSGSFDWTPTFLQSGVYVVTFFTSDGILSDTEAVVITVIEAGNQLPLLDPISDTSLTEGIAFVLPVTASDAESIPALTTSSLPTGATFADNGDGSGSFDWTPGFVQSGSYPVTFYATDDSLAIDSSLIILTVNDGGNQSPVLNPIGAQAVAEGVALNFGFSAFDPEGFTPVLSATNLPAGASIIDSGNGAGSFSWTPDFNQSGTYNVTFYATDDSAAVDSEIITITVNEAGNQAPLLATIGAQSTAEGIQLLFGVSSSDGEDIALLTTSTLPAGATFVDSGNGNGSFSWTPTFVQSGIYNVTFYATDDSLAVDSEVVTITVNEVGNQLPVLAAVGSQSILEGVKLLFAVTATDGESIPVLTTSALPAGANFVDSGNGAASFSWTPNFVQSGIYNVTFYAADDSLAVDSEVVTITVTDAGNQAPLFDSIGSQAIVEGIKLQFIISALDGESIPTLTTSTLPSGAAFVDSANGSGSFVWTPDFVQSGTYSVTFYATDDSLAVDSEVVTITVNDAGNQTPLLTAIGAQIISEGVQLTVTVSASDGESIPALTTSALPTGALFVDSGNGIGSFKWTPTFLQSGVYNITFYATDDSLAVDSELVTITVTEPGNQAPVLATIGAQTVAENVELQFTISAADAEGIPALTTSALPAGAVFIDSGNGSGSFIWTPNFIQSGVYSLTFYATDDSLAVDSEVVTITVNEVGNQLPLLDSIGAQTITEGIQLLFAITASDAESIPILTTSALPTGAVFTDNGNGSGSFDWTPDFLQSGTYNVAFYATDDSLAVDSEVVTITVDEAGNQAPVLDSIGAQTTPEGLQLLFVVNASDGESIPVLTTSALPSGAVFVDSGNGSASFNWLPEFTQAGIYNVTFYATDDSAVVDSELVTITVTEAGNQPPVLDSIPDTSVTESLLLSFIVTASDPDSTIPALSTSILPAGAVFVDSANGTGEFNWTPSFAQNGIYQIIFYASDSLDFDSQVVTITVIDVGNQPPLIDSIGDQSTAEGLILSIVVTASDAESVPALTTSALPIGATFVDSANGNGYFDWTPGFTQAGLYPITFYATDDSSAVDSQLITITVTESGDQPPVFDSLADFTTTELDTLIVTVKAIDPDSSGISLTIITNLTSFSFVDSGNGVGVLTYFPSLFDAGLDTVKFLATDSGSPPRTTTIVSVITTIENNQPPVFDSAGPYAVEVNDTLIFTVFAADSTDQDTTHSVFLTTTGLPANASFTDNGDNTGTFIFAPVAGQEGFDTLGFLATDEGTPALSGLLDVEIRVVGVNIPPVLNPIGAQSVKEGDILTIILTGYDPDSTMIPFFSVDTSQLLGASSLVDSGNGTAVFTYVPNFISSGLRNVTFRIHDGIDFDKEVVIIQVTDFGNRLPLYDSIPSPSVVEGDSLVVFLTAYDPDDGPVVLSIDEAATPLPPNFIFTDSGGGLATLELYPVFNQAGNYPLDLIVADDSSTADTFSMIVQIIEAGPQPPILDSIPDYSVDEATSLTFTITTSDIDSVPPVLTTSALSGSASFTDNGDYTGTFSWTPTHDDSGFYTVTFYATDADPATTMVDSQEITIIVVDVNRAPFMDNLPNPSNTMNEFDTLSLYFTATDQDGSTPSIRVTLSGADTMATNMTFFDSGNGAGVFRFIPDHTQGNDNPTSYSYIVTAIDEFDSTLSQSSGTRTIRVSNVNVAPTLNFLDGAGPFDIVEGEALRFRVLAEDIDGSITSLDVTNLPAGATFSGPVDYFKTLTWTPLFNQAGTYNIKFSTSDNDLAGVNQTVKINVAEFGNHAPFFTTTLPDTIDFFVGVVGNIVVKAQDLDFDNITISLDLGPLSSSFVDSGNGTGVHSYMPDSSVIGLLTSVRFIVTDVPAGLTDTLETIYWIRSFLRGDLDGNFKYTMNDIVYLVNYIYRGGPEPDPLEAGDVDASGAINTADLSYLINFIYRGGPAPPQ